MNTSAHYSTHFLIKTNRYVLVASLVLCICGLVAALTVAHNRADSVVKSERSIPNAAVTSIAERVQVEALTLRPTGFQPSQIIRPQGRFILAVDNRTEMGDLQFQLIGPGGNPVAAKNMRGREFRWRQLLDLPPGDYLLTETNHQRWSAQIRITAR